MKNKEENNKKLNKSGIDKDKKNNEKINLAVNNDGTMNNEEINNSEKLKNIKELEKVRRKYLKLRNTILTILGIIIAIIIVILIIFLYKYFPISKILKTNVMADLGDNCKITYYHNDEKTPIRIIYINDGLFKSVVPVISDAGKGAFINMGNIDGYNYIINEIDWNDEVESVKTYRKIKVSDELPEWYDETKINLLEGFYSGYPKIRFIDVAKFIIEEKGRIEREEYNGKEYIVLRRNKYAKAYINPETKLVEKIVGGTDQYKDEINIVIEKNAVTEEIKLPDLTEYVYEEIYEE